MNIDHAPQEIIRNMEQTQKTGQRHQINSSLSQFMKHRLAEFLHVRKITRPEHETFQTSATCPIDALAVFLAGDHQRDFGSQLTAANLIQKIQQRCAASADQHTQPDRTIRDSGENGTMGMSESTTEEIIRE